MTQDVKMNEVILYAALALHVLCQEVAQHFLSTFSMKTRPSQEMP